MERIVKFLLVFLLVFSFVRPVEALEDDTVTLYLFYGAGCPHCAEEREYLEKLKEKYDFEVVLYEVWKNADNQKFLTQVKEQMEISRSGVPVTIVGDMVIVGYGGSAEGKIERAIKFYKENEYVDQIQNIKDGTYVKSEEQSEFEKAEEKLDGEVSVQVPVVGKINLKNVSLTTSALVLGLIDGFNPCAMWVLLFLLSVLIGMKNKRRMWIIGLTFIGSSAFVYMLIMLSWLNIVVSVSTSIIVRNIIAVVALLGGIVNLINYFKSKDGGCSVVSEKKRKTVFSWIKEFTHEKSLILALIGTVALAFAVNIVELACSAGLPVVYTQLLAINDISGIGAVFYVFIYILFFLLDDLIVFFVAMYTMEVSGISTKYSKYSHLIGGIIMILMGVLLIFKPEWLMFQFN